MKIITYIFLFSLTASLHSQTNLYYSKINKDSVKWSEISQRERIEFLQIPSNILKTMSTKDLLTTCIDYPYIIDVFFYNDYQQGFNNVVSDFNGLQELLNRKDAASYIFELYQLLNIDEISNNTCDYCKGNFSFKLLFLELLLSDTKIQDQLTNGERKILINEVVSKFNSKKKYPEIFSEKTMIGMCYTLEKTLEKEKYYKYLELKQKKNMQGIISPSIIHHDFTIDEIINISNLFLTQ